MTTATVAEGALVTLKGVSYDRETGTLDLTRLRMSVGQTAAAVLLLLSLAAGWGVLVYQVTELRRDMASVAGEVRRLEINDARQDERIGRRETNP